MKNTQTLRILSQTNRWVAIDKPAGFHVHPPEDAAHRISPRHSCVHLLREQLGVKVYPVHRLDRATSGVLLFALDSEAARLLSGQFAERRTAKRYFAVVRGWVAESGVIDSALAAEDVAGEPLQEAYTEYECRGRGELAVPNSRYATTRFSLVEVRPRTGRRHQIRRHFARIAHPLIGDTIYGDGEHNRIWRAETGDRLLYLKAFSLAWRDPESDLPVFTRSRWGGEWQRIFNRAGVCPL